MFLFPPKATKIGKAFSLAKLVQFRVLEVPLSEEYNSQAAELIKELLDQPSSIFHPQRIAILLELYSSGALEYLQLRHDLNLTDGALAAHIKVLSSDGLLEQKKEPIGARIRTTVVLTKRGFDIISGFLDVVSGIRGLVNERI
jgi:DNA-binding MarR family transcriptional regulator